MKKQLLSLVGTLALLLVAGSAFGQTINLRANVPFDFIVAGKTLPAGEYTVQCNVNGIMSVQGLDSRRTMWVTAGGVVSAKPSARTKLVFRHHGDRYFLDQVWMAGNNNGVELPKTDREAEVAMDYSASDAIVVASLR